MNTIDRPIEPTKALKRGIRKPDWSARRTRAYRDRRLAEIEKRRLERETAAFSASYISWSTLPKTVVLVPWHVDETGCRARVVGCD